VLLCSSFADVEAGSTEDEDAAAAADTDVLAVDVSDGPKFPVGVADRSAEDALAWLWPLPLLSGTLPLLAFVVVALSAPL
jgi:hypothetical protein